MLYISSVESLALSPAPEDGAPKWEMKQIGHLLEETEQLIEVVFDGWERKRYSRIIFRTLEGAFMCLYRKFRLRRISG